MGLLKVGKPFGWVQSGPHRAYVREHGVIEFLNIWNSKRDACCDDLLWGDEVEYGIFKVDHEAKTIKLSLRGSEIMDELRRNEMAELHRCEGCTWHPESHAAPVHLLLPLFFSRNAVTVLFPSLPDALGWQYGAWMVEATPRDPFGGYASDLLRVERNMRLRRKRLLSVLAPDEIAPTVTCFPMMGVGDFVSPSFSPGGPVASSSYIPDAIINSHPRFGALTRNIRLRRGDKVNIHIPLFRDAQTPEFSGKSGALLPQPLLPPPPPPSSSSSAAADVSGVSPSASTNDAATASAGAISNGGDKPDTGKVARVLAAEDGGPEPAAAGAAWKPPKAGDAESEFGEEGLSQGFVWQCDPHGSSDVLGGSAVVEVVTMNGHDFPAFPAFAAAAAAPLKVLERSDARPSPPSMLAEAAAATPFAATTAAADAAPAIAAASDAAAARTAATANTGAPTAESASAVSSSPPFSSPSPPAVHMDAMAFGMGCCCLQVTFQARDVDESRYMYDQLAVLAPIMLALTAATPILRGRLVDTDVRWNTIAASVDDRTPAERGELSGAELEAARDQWSAGNSVRRLHKSRYDSISTYLHYCKRREDPMFVLNAYNDIPCEVDEESQRFLLENGVDPALAQHIAHLFVRDPLVIFDGATHEVDDATETEHFENIQSTNWQTVRWKPPPPQLDGNSPHIGWRAEFRSMEVNVTDTENAAFVVFVVLVTRVILAFDLNLYIPLSKVDENMQRAHARDAVGKQKFFWRQHMAPPGDDAADDGGSGSGSESGGNVGVSMNDGGAGAAAEGTGGGGGGSGGNRGGGGSGVGSRAASPTHDDHSHSSDNHEGAHQSCNQPATGFEEMTIQQIMMGKGSYYPGLIPLVYAYLEHIGCDAETTARMHDYMELIRQRATGQLPTTASWMRAFVRAHPAYRGDSVVPEEVAHDLLEECRAIGEGRRQAPELLGDLVIRPIVPEGSYDVKLTSALVSSGRRRELVAKYRHRPSWDESGRNWAGDGAAAGPAAAGRALEMPGTPGRGGGGDHGEEQILRALRAHAGWLQRTPSLSWC